jgi:signal transduction histidine kinase
MRDIGRWAGLLHPDDRARALSTMPRALTGETVCVEYRIVRPSDGVVRWIRDTGFPIPGADGRIRRVGGIAQDVTEEKAAEERLRELNEALEARVAARTAELRQALGTLHREVREREQAAAALTHRLLAFGRQQTLTPKPVSLDRIARDMEDMMRRTVGPSVQVELRLADGHWLVMCDPNQMESALLNLCVNARDAMPDGGWLTVSTGELVLSGADVANHEDARPGRYATIAATDTGTGMAPEVLAHVFEPFFTTKPLGQGTGLGLSQIYGFVRQSGGIAQIDTAPGKGTTVQLCLPCYAQNPDNEASLVPERGKKAVLLVEDEPDVRAARRAASGPWLPGAGGGHRPGGAAPDPGWHAHRLACQRLWPARRHERAPGGRGGAGAASRPARDHRHGLCRQRAHAGGGGDPKAVRAGGADEPGGRQVGAGQFRSALRREPRRRIAPAGAARYMRRLVRAPGP